VVTWTVALEPAVQSVQRSRELVRRVLQGLDSGHVETVTVMTDELVTNAITHGRPPIVLGIQRDPGSVSVTVSDEGPGLPTLHPMVRLAESGRGLLIVDVLSDQWGVDPLPAGKRVWFRMTGGGVETLAARAPALPDP
jgi:anti-sigma regulatory factor (Ser/Thr protein kinase)